MSDEPPDLTDAQKTRLVSNASSYDTTFSTTGQEVLRITADGQLVAGPGLSPDQASREMYRALTQYFKFEWDKRAEQKEKIEELQSDIEKLEEKLATAHRLLDL